MGAFLDAERERQASLKAASPYFSDAARADGIYKGKPRPFCLPQDLAAQNLFSDIREQVVRYFADAAIGWHDGQRGKPSNHLCDSQVCCVNFLFPFAHEPRALAELLRPLFPTLRDMLPIERGQYVSCEWIGERNYLGERVPHNGARTRGANVTSADAAVMLAHSTGERQIVLIEWKYTESYSSAPLAVARSGTDRTAIYAPLYRRADFPLRKDLLASFEALFYEPFYQLLRQQCLAHEMERAHELGADIVSLLHIAPAHNRDFRTVTSPALRHLGARATEVWARLVREPDRFCSIGTEAMFGPILHSQAFPDLRAWQKYITARYAWVVEETTRLNELLEKVTASNLHSEVDIGFARGTEVW